MSATGAQLQSHNNELVKCLEDLRDKRDEINRQIKSEEDERLKIQNDLQILTKRLSQINDSLARKMLTICDRPRAQGASRNEYDKTILETEAAYLKILESSHTLLTVLKRESVHIQKKQQSRV